MSSCCSLDLLIIQEYNWARDTVPDDNVGGGTIAFKFNTPVLFNDIGFADMDDNIHRMRLTYSGGRTGIFKYRGLGDNSVQRVIVDRGYVKKVEVIFEKSGAITEFNFCPMC